MKRKQYLASPNKTGCPEEGSLAEQSPCDECQSCHLRHVIEPTWTPTTETKIKWNNCRKHFNLMRRENLQGWVHPLVTELTLTCCTGQCLASRWAPRGFGWMSHFHIPGGPSAACSRATPAKNEMVTKLGEFSRKKQKETRKNTYLGAPTCFTHTFVVIIWFFSSWNARSDIGYRSRLRGPKNPLDFPFIYVITNHLCNKCKFCLGNKKQMFLSFDMGQGTAVWYHWTAEPAPKQSCEQMDWNLLGFYSVLMESAWDDDSR